jgi:hypothetical protein
MPTWADGELDSSFGTNGVVKIAFPSSSLGYLRDAAIVNGVIEAAGYEHEVEVGCAPPFPNLFIVRLSLGGTVIGSPGSYAQHAINCPAALVVDSTTGDIYLAGYALADSHETAVARFDSAGTLIATYAVTGGFCEAAEAIFDNQSRFVAPCFVAGEFGFEKIGALRLNAQGNQLSGGFLALSHLSVYRMDPTVIAQDASSGAYYVGGAGRCLFPSNCPLSTPNTRTQLVIRLNGDSGALDTAYGSGGAAVAFSISTGAVNGITLDDSGNVVTGGGDGILGTGYVGRLNPTGTPDATFGTNGVVQNIGDSVTDVRTDHSSRVYALGAASELWRFKSNGTRDTSFSSSSQVQTLNGPGSRWQSMQFADSSHASVYLLGGAVGCASGCNDAATTAVIAKVMLVSGAGGPGITTTKLSSSATTITSGQSVTFTASVTGSDPSGTLIFKDGSATLGAVNLSSATASYTTSTLAVGAHSISATYGGDSSNLASTAAAITETVDDAAGGSADGSGGGGGSFAWMDLCAVFLLALWRAHRVRRPELDDGPPLEKLAV